MTRKLTEHDREAIIAFEQNHLGMGENPPGSNRCPPSDWYGIRGPWCAMFQSWSFYSVLGFSPFPASTSKGFAACAAGAQWFRRQGQWAPASATPKRGWLIFFTWPGDSIEHHVGIVTGASGPRDVNTIEGNSSNRVSRLHRRSSISGYAAIPYSQTGGPVTSSDLPILKLGSRGGHVIIVQTILRDKTGTKIIPDGYFGPKTEAPIKNLQRLFKLTVDGIVGPKTWEVLLYLNKAK